MDFIEIDDINDITRLIEVINQNIRTSNYMQKEIKRQEEDQPLFVSEFEDAEPYLEKETPVYDDETFENDILYYMGELLSLTQDASKEEIRLVLPEKDDYDYEKILLRLMAELTRENIEIEKVLSEESISAEDESLLKEEITENLRKKDIIRELVTEKEKEEESEFDEENRLVFMPTQSGNPCVLSELKHIDSEYYEGFIGLFESIITGKFKNLRKFSPNSQTAGLREVKDFKIRVIFSRIGPEEYCVISALTKKTDSNSDYQEQINLRASNFKKLEAKLTEQIKDEEFMQLQATYQEELFNMLGKVSSKGMQKEKRMI